MANDFCAFILTHGRPDRVLTYTALRKHGYTGKIYIVIDNEDETEDEYKKRFGKKVVVFNKRVAAKTTDCGDNFDDFRAVVFARNAIFSIAEKLGYKYFIVLDDDYTDFRYKADNNFKAIDRFGIKNLDRIFEIILEYFKNIPALSIAMAQGGDFFGGADGIKQLTCSRKCMNTFFCSVDRPFQFFGRINEDVNAYVVHGNRGELFFTIMNAAIKQVATQKNQKGLTDIYLSYGTYVKSFYTVIFSPSCATVQLMGSKHKRLHHNISWENAVPKIVPESCKRK